jgi:flagellar biosynthesis protein FliP
MKKGKKCITLAKNITPSCTLSNKMVKNNGNGENEILRREEVQLKSYVFKRNKKENVRLMTSFENRTTQKSTSPVKSVES